MIRPAASAGEIIEEGRTLHHCVGGDNYLSRHSIGTSYILFMRYKKSPEIPLCTIEIKGKRFCNGMRLHDQKPDQRSHPAVAGQIYQTSKGGRTWNK